jgi:hypothetical protein
MPDWLAYRQEHNVTIRLNDYDLVRKGVATTKVSLGSISSDSALEIGAHPTFDFYNGRLDDISIAIG